MGQVTLEKLQADTERFKKNVDPLIGGTDVIIFAFGTDITNDQEYSGDKFEYLKGQGYNYYCNVDSSQYYVQIRDRYFRQGRRNLDGYRMYYNPELLSDLFDVKDVFDPVKMCIRDRESDGSMICIHFCVLFQEQDFFPSGWSMQKNREVPENL